MQTMDATEEIRVETDERQGTGMIAMKLLSALFMLAMSISLYLATGPNVL